MITQSDILILGSGIAGLSIAIKSAQHSPHKAIAIVTKSDKSESNTKYAQGGVAVVLSKADSFQKHIKDTLKAGRYINKKSVVEQVVTKGPKRVKEIIEWGVSFDKDITGDLHLGKEGGHSKNRIVHHKDITGYEIERSLLNKISQLPNVTILQHHFVIDLITNHHLKIGDKKNRCFGAYILNEKTGEVISFSASQTCIATGGIGQVYKHTTNPLIATGDGIAMACRAKALIQGMEFIQFHPTVLHEPQKSPSFLISEAVRGHGALLRDFKGRRFMIDYDERQELAPRDILSQAIDNELKISGQSAVFLDATQTNISEFKTHFPNIYKKCKRIGIDIAKDYIPVVPAMHYLCGGIVVNNKGQTSIENLYACGECANTGLHGANRLASNSLLEALVFAHEIAKAIKKIPKTAQKKLPKWNEKGIVHPKETILISQNRLELQMLMGNYVAIVRSNERLHNALNRIDIIHKETDNFYRNSKVSVSLGELRNLIVIAEIIVRSSISRRENKGTFYNRDLAKN